MFVVNGMDVRVGVAFEPTRSRLQFSSCDECKRKLCKTGILEVLHSVNWALDFDLKIMVSYIQ